MKGTTTTLIGLDRFRATVAAAERDLQDLSEARQRVGTLLLSNSDVPVDTGALEASGAVQDDGTVAWGEDYAGYAHAAQPWTQNAVDASLAEAEDILTDEVTRITSTIKGK